jgi:membrane associated rhomboid family serine protease
VASVRGAAASIHAEIYISLYLLYYCMDAMVSQYAAGRFVWLTVLCVLAAGLVGKTGQAVVLPRSIISCLLGRLAGLCWCMVLHVTRLDVRALAWAGGWAAVSAALLS